MSNLGAMNYAWGIIGLVFLTAFPIGIIFLQIFLSKRENKWLGLMLPLLSFALSLIVISGLFLYSATKTVTIESIAEDGRVIKETVEQPTIQEPVTQTTLGTVAIPFVLLNIPTAILIAIYIACREKRKRNLALDKMKIQDLD